MPHGKFDPDKATDVQEAFWVGLTPKRVADMWQMADIVGDMSADGIEILRKLGDPEHKHLTEFMRDAKPETLTFLKDARPAEIAELENGIELVRAFRTTGRIVRWSIITLFGTFMGAITLYNWWKTPK